MEISEMFFLQDLKRQCGTFLANFIEVDNVVNLLHTGRLFSIPRLEHQCVEFMARNIEEVISFLYKKILFSHFMYKHFRW